MKKSTAVKIIIGFVAIIAIAGSLLLIPPDKMVPFLYGKQLGGIEQKRIETVWVLQKYQVTGLPGEARDWITRYHGEAYGQQVFNSFVNWGLKHPESFIEITEGVEPEKREKLVYILANSIIDNLDEEEFASVFGESEAPIIKEVRERINEQKQHIERHKP
jgi:hypothetical protein